MIPETDRYHGVVLRQIICAANRPLRIRVADITGRVDVFEINGGAIHIKHSSKRLSPWQFTYFDENIGELQALQTQYAPVWEMLVCGIDGVVCLAANEILPLIATGEGPAASVRVSRSRNSMYRVSAQGEKLGRAVRRGVTGFLDALEIAERERAK